MGGFAVSPSPSPSLEASKDKDANDGSGNDDDDKDASSSNDVERLLSDLPFVICEKRGSSFGLRVVIYLGGKLA